nr:40S ribosomal protein S21 [Ipomoea batatas]
MQNEEGQNMDLYIPRKCSATNRLITSKDHASVQINVGHLNEHGVYDGKYTTFALCGFVRAQCILSCTEVNKISGIEVTSELRFVELLTFIAIQLDAVQENAKHRSNMSGYCKKRKAIGEDRRPIGDGGLFDSAVCCLFCFVVKSRRSWVCGNFMALRSIGMRAGVENVVVRVVLRASLMLALNAFRG